MSTVAPETQDGGDLMSSTSVRTLPLGYRFEPTAKEIIYLFLLKKARGIPLPHNAVLECDIYGDKEPWMIFDKSVKRTYYLFTKLKRKNKSMIQRVAGKGAWELQRSDPVLGNGGQVIGYEKLLIFKVKEEIKVRGRSARKEKNGHWVMHEFSLPEDQEGSHYVFCSVRNKDMDGAKTSSVDPGRRETVVVNNIARNRVTSDADDEVPTINYEQRSMDRYEDLNPMEQPQRIASCDSYRPVESFETIKSEQWSDQQPNVPLFDVKAAALSPQEETCQEGESAMRQEHQQLDGSLDAYRQAVNSSGTYSGEHSAGQQLHVPMYQQTHWGSSYRQTQYDQTTNSASQGVTQQEEFESSLVDLFYKYYNYQC